MVKLVMRFLLDTNVFNSLVKGTLAQSDLPTGEYFATHIQRDELSATPHESLRASLLSMFRTIPLTDLPTHSFVLGISRLDEARLSSDSSRFDAMLTRLVELDRKSGKRQSGDNQRRDVLIAETAIANDLTLLTGDEDLATVTRQFGGKVCSPKSNRPTTPSARSPLSRG